jgi:hypothetical protein
MTALSVVRVWRARQIIENLLSLSLLGELFPDYGVPKGPKASTCLSCDSCCLALPLASDIRASCFRWGGEPEIFQANHPCPNILEVWLGRFDFAYVSVNLVGMPRLSGTTLIHV